MNEELKALINAISEDQKRTREDHHQTREEMAELRKSVKSMSDNFSQYWQHVAVWEEQKVQDAEFKKEVRIFMKTSQSILDWCRDCKSTAQKVKIGVYGSLIVAVLIALGVQFK